MRIGDYRFNIQPDASVGLTRLQSGTLKEIGASQGHFTVCRVLAPCTATILGPDRLSPDSAETQYTLIVSTPGGGVIRFPAAAMTWSAVQVGGDDPADLIIGPVKQADPHLALVKAKATARMDSKVTLQAAVDGIVEGTPYQCTASKTVSIDKGKCIVEIEGPREFSTKARYTAIVKDAMSMQVIDGAEVAWTVVAAPPGSVRRTPAAGNSQTIELTAVAAGAAATITLSAAFQSKDLGPCTTSIELAIASCPVPDVTAKIEHKATFRGQGGVAGASSRRVDAGSNPDESWNLAVAQLLNAFPKAGGGAFQETFVDAMTPGKKLPLEFNNKLINDLGKVELMGAGYLVNLGASLGGAIHGASFPTSTRDREIARMSSNGNVALEIKAPAVSDRTETIVLTPSVLPKGDVPQKASIVVLAFFASRVRLQLTSKEDDANDFDTKDFIARYSRSIRDFAPEKLKAVLPAAVKIASDVEGKAFGPPRAEANIEGKAFAKGELEVTSPAAAGKDDLSVEAEDKFRRIVGQERSPAPVVKWDVATRAFNANFGSGAGEVERVGLKIVGDAGLKAHVIEGGAVLARISSMVAVVWIARLECTTTPARETVIKVGAHVHGAGFEAGLPRAFESSERMKSEVKAFLVAQGYVKTGTGFSGDFAVASGALPADPALLTNVRDNFYMGAAPKTAPKGKFKELFDLSVTELNKTLQREKTQRR